MLFLNRLDGLPDQAGHRDGFKPSILKFVKTLCGAAGSL
jgi:hypothetical protein